MWDDLGDLGRGNPMSSSDWFSQCTRQILACDPAHSLTVQQARCEAHLLQKAYGSTMSANDAAAAWLPDD